MSFNQRLKWTFKNLDWKRIIFLGLFWIIILTVAEYFVKPGSPSTLRSEPISLLLLGFLVGFFGEVIYVFIQAGKKADK